MMEEEDAILLAQEQARQQQPLLQALNSMNTKLETQHKRTNKSLSITVNLAVAHEDKSLGLSGTGQIFLWLTVEKVDNAFTYKLAQTNGLKSDSFTGAQGASLDQHEFTDILVTNTATSGEAIIVVGWRE